MIYRNERTGAVIETAAAVSGGGWQEIKPASTAEPAQVKGNKPTKAARRAGK